jgi:hypothetical protein
VSQPRDGAVLGVAVLGMLVNSQLNANLVASLRHLGIPANFQAIVISVAGLVLAAGLFTVLWSGARHH